MCSKSATGTYTVSSMENFNEFSIVLLSTSTQHPIYNAITIPSVAFKAGVDVVIDYDSKVLRGILNYVDDTSISITSLVTSSVIKVYGR